MRCVRLTVGGALAVLAAGVVFVFGPMLFFETFPSTDPDVIERRISDFGVRSVHSSVVCCGPNFERFDVALQGVRSGEPRWLRIAAALRPMLGAHSSEEMDEAVVEAFDANPGGALALLSGAYSTNVVCGGQGTEVSIDASRARSRLETLSKVPGGTPGLDACRAILSHLATSPRP